jgi:hypothetical protein
MVSLFGELNLFMLFTDCTMTNIYFFESQIIVDFVPHLNLLQQRDYV